MSSRPKCGGVTGGMSSKARCGGVTGGMSSKPKCGGVTGGMSSRAMCDGTTGDKFETTKAELPIAQAEIKATRLTFIMDAPELKN
jgi:hypothetical protein